MGINILTAGNVDQLLVLLYKLLQGQYHVLKPTQRINQLYCVGAYNYVLQWYYV